MTTKRSYIVKKGLGWGRGKVRQTWRKTMERKRMINKSERKREYIILYSTDDRPSDLRHTDILLKRYTDTA